MSSSKDKRLLDEVRDYMRLKHYSIHTERAYCDWIKRFIHFHQMSSRDDLKNGEQKIEEFLTLQRQSAQSSHFFNLPFSMRLISKVIPVLNPSHHFQRFIHVESPQGQNHLQENPKLRERNGWSFFSPILFSNAREKNEPACTSTCGGSILQIFLLRTDPSLTRSWSPRSIAL
jgi:hypothetical protein